MPNTTDSNSGTTQTVSISKTRFSGNSVPPLSLEGNLSNNWIGWLQHFKIYMRAGGLKNEEDSKKVAIFLHYIGPDALCIFNSINLDNDLVTKFEAHCKPKSNLTAERHNLLTGCQIPEESNDDFVTALCTCELDNLCESLVRDMFVVGLSSGNRTIKERLLQEDNLDLDKAIKITKSIEITQLQAQQLQEHSEVMVYKVNQQGGSNQWSEPRQYRQSHVTRNQQGRPGQRGIVSGQVSQTGRKCGQRHHQKCPAQGAVCKIVIK